MRCCKLKAIAAFLAVSAIAASQQALAIEVDLCKFSVRTSAVFFSNGVGNSPGLARRSLEELYLQLKTGAALVAPEGSVATAALLAGESEFISLYHANNGPEQDISETLLQKARAEARNQDVTWENIIALAKGLPTPNIAIHAMLSAIVSFNQGEIKRKALSQVALESKDDLKTLTAYLKSKPGSRALIVGHSQGTLYANALYESAVALQATGAWAHSMSVEDSVRVVNVGVAADRVAGQVDPSSPPQYVTSSNDLVILSLRALSAAVDLSPPLPTNNGAHFVTSAPEAGLLGFSDVIANHGFVSTYLYDGLSRYPLRTLLRNVLLQWVMGYDSVRRGALLEMEYDVDISRDPTYTNADSTSISPATQLGPFVPLHAVTPFKSSDTSEIYGFKGVSTLRMASYYYCNYDTYHDLRPDSPKSEALKDVIGGSFIQKWVVNPARPVTVLRARYRAVGPNGPTDWTSVNPSAITNSSTAISVKLFDYDMALRPGSVHLATR